MKLSNPHFLPTPNKTPNNEKLFEVYFNVSHIEAIDRPVRDKNLPITKPQKSYKAKNHQPKDPVTQMRLLASKEAFKTMFAPLLTSVLVNYLFLVIYSLKKSIHFFWLPA